MMVDLVLLTPRSQMLMWGLEKLLHRWTFGTVRMVGMKTWVSVLRRVVVVVMLLLRSRPTLVLRLVTFVMPVAFVLKILGIVDGRLCLKERMLLLLASHGAMVVLWWTMTLFALLGLQSDPRFAK